MVPIINISRQRVISIDCKTLIIGGLDSPPGSTTRRHHLESSQLSYRFSGNGPRITPSKIQPLSNI